MGAQGDVKRGRPPKLPQLEHPMAECARTDILEEDREAKAVAETAESGPMAVEELGSVEPWRP